MSEKLRWKNGDIIRERKTGKPFLVLHIYKKVCTLVCAMKSRSKIGIVLLPRNYSEFASDLEMRQEITRRENGEIEEDWQEDTRKEDIFA